MTTIEHYSTLSILIEPSSWNQRFFSEPPQLITDSHYMVLPQTLPYCISIVHAKFQILLINIIQLNNILFHRDGKTEHVQVIIRVGIYL